jgi:AraC-like DNA-binding protein
MGAFSKVMKNVLIDPSNERKIVDFRELGFRDVLALGRYSYAHAHEPLREHTHGEMFEICYLDEGTQEYEVEGRRFLLKGGDVFVTFPNEMHGSGSSPLSRGRLYWMLISVPSKRERFLNLSPREGQELVGGLLDIPYRHFKGGAQLKHHLENIFKVHDRDDAVLREAGLKNHILRFLLDVLERAQLHARTVISPVITRVQEYIEGHIFEEPPQIRDLAEVAGLSESRFKVRFKEESGMSPGSYISAVKIEKAKELLEDTGLSVTEIAFRLGFSSSQYFATVFKRFTTMRPLQWRAVEMPNGGQKE